MLTREFIDDSLYNHNYGYFSKHATIFRPGEPFYFNEIEDGPAFYRMLGERYHEFEDQLDETNPDVARQLWHTPTELFRPYYGETIARYLVSNYKLTLYPYHDLIIYEMGAGNGTMMMNILDYIRDTDYEVYQRTKYKIIEISPSLASLQMQNLTDSLDAAGHSDRVEIINRSIFDWDTYVHSPCFFLALEVFDNFSHDQIRYDLKTELPQQGGVLIDANGEFLEYYNTQLDPIASRFLRVRQAAARRKFRTPLTSKYMKLMRSQLPWQQGHRYTLPEYIPTRLMQFFDILNTYFPGHRLIASDFDTLPDAVPGVNAPVVQTRYKRRTVPVSTPFVHQGYFDIFFPTDFNTTEDIYRAVTGKLTQVMSHEDFMRRWAYIGTKAMTIPTWKSTVHKKRAAQLAAIPPDWRLPESITADPPLNALEAIRSCDILTEKEQEWTEINDSTVLLSMLANREISSVQLTTAFCKRAAVAQQLTKCLTEIFFDRALARAKELDDILEKTGKVTGPLHGLPVSIKDRFDVEGYDTTVGWVGLVGKPAQSSSSIALSLESMGAVLYVKTNVPQSLMMSDSYNHVFGQSINAFNKQLISGGSSGGEGALIGTGGSVVGIGTDIGGSIRPMARSLSSIEHFMQSLLDSNPWNIDPGCIPIPWRKELAAKPTGKLRLGIVYDDGVVKPQPPIARAMREVAKKLKEAGHEVFEWDTSLHTTGQNLWTKAILADGGQHCRYLCDIVGEPLIEGMVVGTEKDELTISEREELEETKWAYQTSFLQQWTSSNIDALLMPVTPWVGYRPKSWVVSSQWLGYTALWNLLNYAAVTVPVAKVDGALDQPDQEWLEHVPRNDSDRFNWEQYDPDLVKDMPITVQIVGGRFGEEKAVSVAKVVDEVLQEP
ncbi:amidase signature enzyme [Aspergillus niger CBS 101883]|uniref:type II protein arginine methyltransferase n=2 Tax=Aspergillus TaxID=5052 RepID=A0A370PQ74_ASPPH|nr:amidase signature enzyme [Aspergillus niger CBS 101883]PYH61267.1 amidase signature enzyme [Aspergillus niger CBS 101883]RDH21440.1 amidase signature enzyme [Aspergillus niger ATCC 13496]RDK44311.1 amidase signature enzyme [Aspergillus phoenicis ATCC 13157]